jgi:hypothetical protein
MTESSRKMIEPWRSGHHALLPKGYGANEFGLPHRPLEILPRTAGLESEAYLIAGEIWSIGFGAVPLQRKE